MIDHRLTTRAHHLAEAIRHRQQLLVSMLKPLGAALPFTEQVSTEEAYKWWMANRYEKTGKTILGTYTPARIAALDAWLADQTAKRQDRPLLP